ncbi:hypothetical protein N5079_28360 [Planotetraspora sp. A-T 1434]|uniref:hypothetical protein n=1 Tax=Planotetraspora sp. A-T 1434 TaxID=2979219 RepID=UPI0021C24500|nr:hypothetical protein [Planotetraspora sp. A-T 1434]MCT9934128.1 hypothetical protein [Planotetraspora sp. A-T 1434]
MIELLRETSRSAKPQAIELLAVHLAPSGTHYVIPWPRKSWDALVEGCISVAMVLRMDDGALIKSGLHRSVPVERVQQLPQTLSRWEEYRTARRARGIRRDFHVWSRDHRHDHSCKHTHCVERREGHCSCFTFLEDMRTARDRPAGLERGSAQEAIRLLMARGFVEIRAVSHIVKRALAAGETDEALKHLEHLRMIADVCHNLPQDFYPKRPKIREREAIESLRFHLRELDPDDRAAQWVVRQLEDQGFDYVRVLRDRTKWKHAR